jgi:cellulose synthase/poly-beta-1,6-N-acetylglucosamine synthase-like glycosyltransferase
VAGLMRCRPAVDFRGDCTLLYKGLGRCGRNAGSKAEAQAFALPFATTAFCVASDPDTEVAPDAMEHLTVPFADSLCRPGVAATRGFGT